MIEQTPVQLWNHYTQQKKRCIEIYAALQDNFADADKIEDVAVMIRFNNCMANLYAFVVKMNKQAEAYE